MGDMIRCHRCGTHHYRNDPCPDFESRCGDHSATEPDRMWGAIELLSVRLTTLGQAPYADAVLRQCGLQPPKFVAREATGKD